MSPSDPQDDVLGRSYSCAMAQAGAHQVEELAAKVMRRQHEQPAVPRLSVVRRWRESRYRRALATAPVDALIAALTEARNKHDTPVRG